SPLTSCRLSINFFQCCSFFFFTDTSTTQIYTLSLHDALPILKTLTQRGVEAFRQLPITWSPDRQEVRVLKARITKPDGSVVDSLDRKSTRLNSSHVAISYAVFCLKKKKKDRSTVTILNNFHRY